MTATVFSTKIGKVENKISDASGLVTTTVFETKIGEVKNKIPDVTYFIKKTDYYAKISDTERKYFTTSDYDKFTGKTLDAKIKGKGLIDKSSVSNLVKESDLNRKITTLTTKGELKAEQGNIVKLQAFNSSYF